jgi:hypothetical protein
MLKYNWQLFRRVEKLSLMESAYYLSCNVVGKIMKQ